MYNFSWCMKTIVSVFSWLIQINTAHVMRNLLKSILHVFGLSHLNIRPFIVKLKNRNAIIIYGSWVYFTIIIFNRQTFTSTPKTYNCTIIRLDLIAKFISISTRGKSYQLIKATLVKTKAIIGLPHTAPNFNVIPSWKI